MANVASREPVEIDHLTPGEHAELGRAARRASPRADHARWKPAADRADPVEVLSAQATTRVPELVPIRYGRMLASAFTFYRGAAAIMAGDLAGTPQSGLTAQLCGDAHLSNFGAFAAPDRRLVFDLNDFDETLPGPWEWDVKRLAASVEIAGRDRGFAAKRRRTMVIAAVREYRKTMRAFAAMRNLEVWYARLDADELIARFGATAKTKDLKTVRRAEAKTRKKDSLRALGKLTEQVDGEVRFVSRPPLLVPIEELLPADAASDVIDGMRALVRAYRATLSDDRRHLLENYRYVHVARKVVGVGSVGTRAWVVLLEGRDGGDPLVLQAKEAEASVLEPYAGASEYDNHGQRVVEGQRLMQAASDSFLGWEHVTGIDDVERDFYIRQLWDEKGSADVSLMSPESLEAYVRACGWTLARAHARSGDRIAMSTYLGSSDSFDRAIADFADAYADQNDADFAAVSAAVADGRIVAQTGI